MNIPEIKQNIKDGETFLGIEFGSTRIKAVLTGGDLSAAAAGIYEWENEFTGGVWTYGLDKVWTGLRECYAALRADVQKKYGAELETVGAVGISAMMHGYLVFDSGGNLLVPMRTWRNTKQAEAAGILTRELNFNIPERWSAAHLYQCVLNGESHVNGISFMTTLSGYVHHALTGERVIGIGDASGMFPIDSQTLSYDLPMAERFDALLKKAGVKIKLAGILPKVLTAGQTAGNLSAQGAKLLDPTGLLKPGIPLCPPEGDAGTGMTATNSVAERTGNVSAGTSVFSMTVLERGLSGVYPEIDMVTTPAGKPAAMVHCNNCTCDIDAWISLFGEAAASLGHAADKDTLYGVLYDKALEGESACGGITSYNYYSGESITGFDEGRPLLVRGVNHRFTLANFMRSLLFSSLASLKTGMDILMKEENARLDKICGHGGFFKSGKAGRQLMSAALRVPVTVMESAGEGGALGAAILAAFMIQKENGETLESYLDKKVFGKNGTGAQTVTASEEDSAGFAEFMERYVKGLSVERAAVEYL